MNDKWYTGIGNDQSIVAMPPLSPVISGRNWVRTYAFYVGLAADWFDKKWWSVHIVMYGAQNWVYIA